MHVCPFDGRQSLALLYCMSARGEFTCQHQNGITRHVFTAARISSATPIQPPFGTEHVCACDDDDDDVMCVCMKSRECVHNILIPTAAADVLYSTNKTSRNPSRRPRKTVPVLMRQIRMRVWCQYVSRWSTLAVERLYGGNAREHNLSALSHVCN